MNWQIHMRKSRRNRRQLETPAQTARHHRRRFRSRLKLESLEPRWMLALLTPDSPDIIGNKTFNEEIQVQGATRIVVFGDLVLESGAVLRGDGVGGADDLTLDVQGSVTLRGPIGGAGLRHLNIKADRTITVADGVVIGIDGNLSFEIEASVEPTLDLLNPLWSTIGASSTISIGAASVTANDVTLVSNAVNTKFAGFKIFEDGLFDSLLNGGAIPQSSATTLTFQTVADRPVIRRESGNWLNDGFAAGMSIKVIGSAANDGDYFTIDSLTSSELRLVATDSIGEETATNAIVRQVVTSIRPEDVSLVGIDKNGKPTGVGTIDVEFATQVLQREVLGRVVDFNMLADAVFGSSTSEIQLHDGANIHARGSFTADAAAKSDIGIATPSTLLGAAWGESTAIARTIIHSNVNINAASQVTIQASTENNLTVALSLNGGVVLSTAQRALQVPGAQFGFAYGKGRSQSEAIVHAGARIQAADVAVDASNSNDFDISANAKKFSKDQSGLGLAVAISDTESTSEARVDGAITSLGDLAVHAASSNEENDVNASAVLRDKIPGASQIRQVGKYQQKVRDTLATLDKLAESQGPPEGAKLDLAAALVFADGTNRVDAIVGGTATLHIAGDLEVNAEATDNFQSAASGGANASASVAIAGAFALVQHQNLANAYIDSGALVNVTGNLEISSLAIVPNQVTIDDDLQAILDIDPSLPGIDTSSPLATIESVDTNIVALRDKLDTLGRISPYLNRRLGIPDKLATTFVSTSAAAKKPGGGGFGVSGGINILTVGNTANAWIAEAARINLDVTSPKPDQSVKVDANAFVETVNIAGISSLVALIKPPSKSEGASVGGNYEGVNYSNTARAYIDDDVHIRSAGNIEINSQTGSLIVNVVESGAQAATFGVEGAFVVNQIDHKTLAYVEESAVLQAGNAVIVNADNLTRAITVAGTVLKSSQIGVGATASVQSLEQNTAAFLGDLPVRVVGQPNVNELSPDLMPTLAFAANGSAPDTITRDEGSWLDDGFHVGQWISVSGTARNNRAMQIAAISANGGLLTLAPGSLIADETIEANESMVTGDARRPGAGARTNTPGTIDATSDVRVTANSRELVINVSIAAALRTVKKQEPNGDQPGNNGDPLDGESLPLLFGDQPVSNIRQKSGISISGDVAIHDVDSQTLAWISDFAQVSAAGDVLVQANSRGLLIGVAGAAALQMSGDSAKFSLAGSFTLDDLDRDVHAILGETKIVARNVHVLADSDDTVVSVTAGGAGSLRKSNAGFAVAGSVNVHLNDSRVMAVIGANADVRAAGEVRVEAKDTPLMVSVAGAAAFDASAIGAAVDVSQSHREVRAVIGAFAVVKATGNVLVTALASEFIVSVAASLAVGTRKLGVIGSGSSQNLDTTVVAEIRDRANVHTDASLLVDAHHDNDVIIIGGGLALGRNTAFAASVANFNQRRLVRALIGEDAIVNALGRSTPLSDAQAQVQASGVIVDATVDDFVVLVGAGGSGGQQFAGAASATVHTQESQVEALVGQRARVNQEVGGADSQSVAIRADRTSHYVSVAGALAGSKQIGIGAAADVATLTHSVRAEIAANALVQARSNINVDANAQDSLTSVAVGVGGSAQVGIAGSASVLVWSGTTSALVGDSTQLTAEGSVRVSAIGDASFTTVDGVAAIGKSGGFGVSNSTLVKTDVVEARIGNSAKVVARGLRADLLHLTGQRTVDGERTTAAARGVIVVAVSWDDATSAVIGVGLAGSGAAAASATVNVSNETTRASLGDSVLINQNQDLAGDPSQLVLVLAADHTALVGAAGGIGFGGRLGGNASADFSKLTKSTQAWIGVNTLVDSAGDVQVRAESSEDLMSVGVSGAAGSNGGLAGAAAVSVHNVVTQACVGCQLDGSVPQRLISPANVSTNTVIAAIGNVQVAADEKMELDSIAGSVGGALEGLAVAASGGVPVITKTTESFLGKHVQINALAARATELVAATGRYSASHVSDDSLSLAFFPSATTVVNGTTLEFPSAHHLRTGQALRYNTGGTQPITGLQNEEVYYVRVIDPRRISLSRSALADVPLRGLDGAVAAGAMHQFTIQGEVNANDFSGQPAVFRPSNDLVGGNRIRFAKPHGFRDGQAVVYETGGGGAVQGLTPGSTYWVIVVNDHEIQLAATQDDASGANGKSRVPISGLSAQNASGVSHALRPLKLSQAAPGLSPTDDPEASAQRVITRELDRLKGIVVTATNQDDLETYTASLSGALAAGAVSGAVNVITTSTRAFADSNAKLITNGAARIAAGSNYSQIAVAGAASTGVSPGAAVTLLDESTMATMGEQVTVTAQGDIEVRAHAQQYVLEIGATASLAMAGNAAVLTLDSTTQAIVGQGATLTTGDDLMIKAVDDSDIDIIAGSASGGIGASATVVLVNKDTHALAGPSVFNTNLPATRLFAADALDVLADSSENIFAVGIAGSLGTGIAGAATVAIVDSDTEAAIGIATRVNRGLEGLDLPTAASSQIVRVLANNVLHLLSVGGAVALGGFGLAGGVDVGLIRNNTLARVREDAEVAALSDVIVDADSFRDVDSYAISAGLSLTVSLAGAVSVYSFGQTLDSHDQGGRDRLLAQEQTSSSTSQPTNQSAITFVEDDLAKGQLNRFSSVLTRHVSPNSGGPESSPTNASLASGIASAAHDDLTDRADDQIGLAASLRAPSSLVGTQVIIGTNARIASGRNLTLFAFHHVQFDATAGAGSAAAFSANASVAIADFQERVEVNVQANARLSATQEVLVDANYVNDSSLLAVGGTLGFRRIGGAGGYCPPLGDCFHSVRRRGCDRGNQSTFAGRGSRTNGGCDDRRRRVRVSCDWRLDCLQRTAGYCQHNTCRRFACGCHTRC
jgi:hypothetical protein